MGVFLDRDAWFLVSTPSTPQFIRPTVPRPVNIDDFACFIRPNVRPIRPKGALGRFPTLNLDHNPNLTQD